MIKEIFAEQAASCGRMGSPFMARMLVILADVLEGSQGPVAERIRAWEGDPSSLADNVPLRLAGGLHALILAEADAELAAAYPPNEVSDAALSAALETALERHAPALFDALTRAPQTNEVRRAAVLIAAAHELGALYGLPLWVSEIGASAGLNLNFDQFALDVGLGFGARGSDVRLAPEWRGTLPPKAPFEIAGREGVDLTPFDTNDPEAQMRLLSYLWPDQPERLTRTKAALALPSPRVVAADALDWLPQRLASAPDDHLHLVYSTVAWQYLPPPARARGAAMMEAAGAALKPGQVLAWLRMEADNIPESACLTLDLWPNRVTYTLGRADFHGRWIEWHGIGTQNDVGKRPK